MSSLVGKLLKTNMYTTAGRYVRSSVPVKQRITQEYADGTVRTESGDVWSVAHTKHGLVATA